MKKIDLKYIDSGIIKCAPHLTLALKHYLEGSDAVEKVEQWGGTETCSTLRVFLSDLADDNDRAEIAKDLQEIAEEVDAE